MTYNRPQMKPTVFVHAKKDQWVGAKVSAYSFKRNSAHPDQFDVRIIFLEDYPFLARREGQSFRRDKMVIPWNVKDPQSFTLLRFLPPQLMGYQNKAVVVDPDIFAVGDIMDLFNRDMKDAAVLCRKIYPKPTSKKPNHRPFNVSSVMLMDCPKLRHWEWEKNIEDVFSGKRNYNHWMSLRLESPDSIGELEECWNHMDTLDPTTRLLHNTRRSTQPWMTGLPYDAYRNVKLMKIIPERWVNGILSLFRGEGYLPYGRYQKHPDPRQEKFFMSLLKECLDKNEITRDELSDHISQKNVRPDVFELLSSL